MVRGIKFINEELTVNIQMRFFQCFHQYDALTYWEIKETCKQEPYNKKKQD